MNFNLSAFTIQIVKLSHLTKPTLVLLHPLICVPHDMIDLLLLEKLVKFIAFRLNTKAQILPPRQPTRAIPGMLKPHAAAAAVDSFYKQHRVSWEDKEESEGWIDRPSEL